MKKLTMYQKSIKEIMDDNSVNDGFDPRHIEGWMRIEHGTLDHLTQKQFYKEVMIGIQCILDGGVELSEENAINFGL